MTGGSEVAPCPNRGVLRRMEDLDTERQNQTSEDRTGHQRTEMVEQRPKSHNIANGVESGLSGAARPVASSGARGRDGDPPGSGMVAPRLPPGSRLDADARDSIRQVEAAEGSIPPAAR
jgi:hypothetical protein